MEDYQPIDIDPPSPNHHNPPKQHPHKRRRIKSPVPGARSPAIDPSLARALWNEQPTSHPSRRRRSSQNFGDCFPAPKKTRRAGPRSPRGSKRHTSPDIPGLSANDGTHNKRRRKDHTLPMSTRPKTLLTHFPKLPASRLKTKNTPPSSSSSNFILSAEARTKYAKDVAEAEKYREEGNKSYKKKLYQLAINSYAQALELYPRQPLPNRPHHPGYSTSFANLGSAYMALSEYHLAAEALQKSIEAVEISPLLPQETRNTLIKRLFRLTRCHLALLDSQAASSTLSLLQDAQSPVNITPNDSSFLQELSILLHRSRFLLEAQLQLDQARTDLEWETVLETIQNTQVEVLTWGFNIKPGFWPLWKAEALARLGKPLEAREATFPLKDSSAFTSELKMVEALICLASGNLDEADAKLTDIMNKDLDDPNAPLLSAYVKGLIVQLIKIQNTCSQSGYLQAVVQCERFLSSLIEPITLTLRIKTYTIMCEQLSEHCIRDPDLQYHLSHKIVDLSNMILTKYLEFSSASSIEERATTYPIYRPYVIRILLARARATLELMPRVSKSTYASIFELLDQIWPDLKIHDRAGILAEIQARIGVSSRTHRPNFSHSDLHSPSHRFSFWDPKGYYQILEVRKDASASEIKKSFRRLSLKHHPDKGGKTEFFQDMSIAYEVLSNQNSRNSYDLYGR